MIPHHFENALLGPKNTSGRCRARRVQSGSHEPDRNLTHSLLKTPRRHKGPMRDFLSNVAAVAFGGLHCGSRVNIRAILFMLTRASTPLITERQEESLPPIPSGRIKDS